MIEQLLRTPLTELVGVRHPVVQTGMGWVAGPRLVVGTANAGGLGILASATMTFEELDHAMRIASVHPGVSVEEVQEQTGFPLVADDVPTTREPTDKELRLLRDVLDPNGARDKEVPA